MATYSVDYLSRLIDATERFEGAFERWMETQEERDLVSARGLLPTVWTKDDQDPGRVRELELEVAEAAGGASKAVPVTGAYLSVAGMGSIDPIANWGLMSSPRALVSPQYIRTTSATIRGRLHAMAEEASAAADSELPAFAPAQLHPVIWSSAAPHWTAPGNPEPGKPKIAWPGDSDDKTIKSVRGGLEPLAKALNALATGLNLTVRNVATHSRSELSEQDAMERLAAYSYLARLLDECEVLTSARVECQEVV